jgi:hypothetical protein
MQFSDHKVLKTPKPYPEWICDECGRLHGIRRQRDIYSCE